MPKMNRLNGVLSLLIVVLFACESPPAEKTVDTTETEGIVVLATKAHAEEAIREIDALRSGLALTIGEGEVDLKTFAQVCKPVGKRANEIGHQNGWIVRQMAVKYRNPGNKADPEVAALLPLFEREVELDSMWLKTEYEGEAGLRYLRRIEVEPSCLACHGAKEARPDFVVTGYPDDRAYDFVAGDLRGVYSVFIPDSSMVARNTSKLDIP